VRGDERFGPRSLEALGHAATGGALVACEVVWSEVIALFGQPEDGRRTLEEFGVEFSPITIGSAERAGALVAGLSPRWWSARAADG